VRSLVSKLMKLLGLEETVFSPVKEEKKDDEAAYG
jgi:hypothetical protein